MHPSIGRFIRKPSYGRGWGTLKCEKYYLHKYATFEELEKDVEDYIRYYNYDRLQAKINSLSPMEVRTKAA